MTHDTTAMEFPRNAVAMWSSGLSTLLAVTGFLAQKGVSIWTLSDGTPYQDENIIKLH